jgi:predicted transcriptional regulator of viral defense system
MLDMAGRSILGRIEVQNYANPYLKGNKMRRFDRSGVAMAVRHAGVPPEIAQAPLRTVRARDVKTYAQSHKDLARLEARGLLHRLAEGFYVVVPQERVGSNWRPTLEGAAAGIGSAEFGPGQCALMSLTAARLHRAIPRAVAIAVVAAPRRRRNLQMNDRQATVLFRTRDVNALQVEMMQTDLGGCLVTTPEQTVLDLAYRPNIGELEEEATAAIRSLLPRCDRDLMAEIAKTQRLGRAFNRVSKMQR